ncbi:hypothetical protein [Natrarchaeobaculum sulfurireducens]|uniref:Uncharacterized protein n=1 Tax=Natrarchaeobaculum sulfurireducens TaxID=2044521 RepID=A0A346PHL0_9EURY|nr:hypothetical protein [Natrarchaeobaculum sulfurireducens]AXR79005.1 hypothetical protein AArc1_2692 [Natrarchaeobaculum sulfurireducens]
MRSYSGPTIDAGYQPISERPTLEEQADEVVYATDPDLGGTERTEGTPTIDDDTDEPERPAVPGQTTIGEWSQL